MSPEVCPFCGKTYKRLKSHLPHCKAAAGAPGSAQQPLSHKSSPQKLAVGAGPPSKKRETVPAARAQAAAPGSAAVPSAARMKKQKLSEQMKAPSTVSLRSEPQPPRPTTSKTKAKAAGPQERAPEGASRAQPAAQTETKVRTDEDASQPASSDGSSTGPKKQATAAVSVAQNYKRDENAGRETDLVTAERELEDFPVNVEPGNHQSRIVLQDVTAVLGRVRSSLNSSRPSIPVQVRSSDPSEPGSSLSRLASQGHRATKGLSTAQVSSTKLPPATLEPLGSPDRPMKESRPVEGRKPTFSEGRSEGVLAQRRLAQVRLKDLPEWLACNTPTQPRDVVETVRRGWQWYYRKYIDVKRGGVGGVAMLLAGYCLLSYAWTYPHTKRDRWRKFH